MPHRGREAGLCGKLVDALFDDTFTDIYRLQPFDYAILVPYFAVLIVLSFYGIHRYHMIRGYLKYRKQMPVEAPQKKRRSERACRLRHRQVRAPVAYAIDRPYRCRWRR